METNRLITIPYALEKCNDSGRIGNFEVAGGLKQGGFAGLFYDDSDVFKIVEGASYSLVLRPDPELEAALEGLIEIIAAAQEKDGYLYTARTINDPAHDYPGKAERWSDIKDGHELYNVGHLYEAAVAHYRATGRRILLDVAIRNADLVCSVFGEEAGQRKDAPGHEEIEIGLVKLYQATGDEKYLRQAGFFIDMRGRSDRRGIFGSHYQDHKPVAEQEQAVGHAVRAVYLYAGVADVAALAENRELLHAIDRIWDDIVSTKMYLTGGIGSRHAGEAFGESYELPNKTAYCETCAAIAHAMFNHRMFLLHGDSRYIDVLERIIYNGFLSGVSLSGDRFFYPNPLESDGAYPFNKGESERKPWFETSCCPVNTTRFIPSIPGYVYAVRDRSLYVNLFVGGTARIALPDDGEVVIRQTTRYPWEGHVRLAVTPSVAERFALHIRIPGWALGCPVPGNLYRYEPGHEAGYQITVNGEPVCPPIEKGYAVIDRFWEEGDIIEVELPMPVNRVHCHSKVVGNRGRVAIERGPLVYCAEGADHGGKALNLALPEDAVLAPRHESSRLGGITVLKG
ncbi:MAG: glycoside hydrolase family 127 protein, partial [Verrucomicrobiota bacterium]